jgi:hypothetical protein
MCSISLKQFDSLKQLDSLKQSDNLKQSDSVKQLESLIFFWFDLFCLMPLSAIFQLYHGVPGENHKQATGKLHHLRLRVECTLFVIYKAGCEPTSY